MSKRFIAIGICLALSFSVRAAEPQKGPTPEDLAKAMEMMTKLAQVGPEHKKMEDLVGEFKATVKYWMGPGEPQTTTGKTKNELIFGGRFLKCDYSGEFMGKPFKGMELMGYDNQKKKYVMTWCDEMSTSIMSLEGELDATGKVLSMSTEYDDPMTNKKEKMRMVTTLIDKDNHRFEMYCTAMSPDGKEAKNMEITYTRVK